MSNNPRDTQFQGFATLLIDEMIKQGGGCIILEHDDDEDVPPFPDVLVCKKLITQRAYDLVRRTLSNIAPIDLDRLSLDEQVETIPDMTEWEAQ